MHTAPAASPGDAPSACAAIVDVPPPPREAAVALARFLVEIFARRALVDLGLIPAEETDPGTGIADEAPAFSPSAPLGARCGVMAGKVDVR